MGYAAFPFWTGCAFGSLGNQLSWHHMETVFHYRAQRQINELERKDMVEMLLKKAILNTMQKKADLIYQDSRDDIAQMEQLGWEPLLACLAFGADRFQPGALFLSSLEFTCRINYLWYSDGSFTPNFQSRSWKMPEIFAPRLQAETVSQFKELLAGYDVLRSFWKKIEWFTEQKLQMSKWKP